MQRARVTEAWEAVREPWVYRDLVRPVEVVRVAVRYINRIPFPPDVNIEELFRTGPRFPTDMSDDFSAYMSRIVLEDREHEMSAIVSQHIEPSTTGEKPVFVLDIDAYKADRFGKDVTDLQACLTSLREFKNRIFFGSLTERLVQEFV